ncbi:GPI transamidase component [Vanrija albida]|uniref:GPI transamidase component n=1 Tax=Vanrija albida TaxID=181172 RepID=A0ABR3Q8S4_9TREE
MSKSDPPGAASPAAPESDADAVLRALNPAPSRRLLVALCFPLFAALLIPYWWWATAIERLPLPGERIAVLENTPTPQIVTRIALSADAGAFPRPGGDRADFPLRTKLQALAREVTAGVDGILGQQRPAVRGERRWELVTDGADAALRVHIALDAAANASFPLEPYVSTGVEGGRPAGTLVIPVNPAQVADVNLKRHYKIALINGIHNLLPAHLPGVPVRALAYRPNITLSFVLLNEDAADGSYVSGWDVEAALRDHFAPHLAPLAPVFNFSVESQVLYHAPLTFDPAPEADAWRINDEQLKVFVSERWSLDSGSTNNPVLRFLVFVPSAAHRPLRLGAENADAFLIPQFGSVVLLNPPASGPKAYRLGLDALDAPFAQFVDHFYALLSIPARPAQVHPAPSDAARTARGLASPLSPWQLDTVLRTRLAENAAEAKKTLAGIVRLIDKIDEMQVGAGVRDKILGAVRKLEGLPATARASSPRAAFVLSRDAVALANEAFFDPSMMGQLYFPDQHKFAVYTPLFAPVGVSIIAGLLRELRAWIKRRKARRAAQAAAGSDKSAATSATSTATPAASDAARLRTTAAQ